MRSNLSIAFHQKNKKHLHLKDAGVKERGNILRKNSSCCYKCTGVVIAV